MQGTFRRVVRVVAGLLLAGAMAGTAEAQGACSRFKVSESSARNGSTVSLPWRTDLPAAPGTAAHAWEAIPLTSWEAYMAAVLSEIRASGLKVQGARIVMNATADWWITPWMDYGDSGREKRLGLTKERDAQLHDLSPTSAAGAQVWAVGFYNREGASALGKVFAGCARGLAHGGDVRSCSGVIDRLLVGVLGVLVANDVIVGLRQSDQTRSGVSGTLDDGA